jgi:hypothetical protein
MSFARMKLESARMKDLHLGKLKTFYLVIARLEFVPLYSKRFISSLKSKLALLFLRGSL